MNREIKFRGQHTYRGTNVPVWIYFELDEYPAIYEEYGHLINKTQYTGILDKNGTEIYEGDIVKDSIGKVSVVKWEEELGSCGCCFNSFTGCGFTVNGEEVVGNIYENPELI